MLKGDDLLGVILVYHNEVRPFTDRQIALVETFADQAVIAIENVRLFEEVQARTRELSESLEQQTATSEVLQVISSTPGNLEPVFQTMLESARELCSAPQSMVVLRDGDRLRMAMQVGYPPEFEKYIRDNPVKIDPNTGAGRAAFTGQVAHFADVLADPSYRFSTGQRIGGYRAMLSVPLLREKEVVGVFSLGRPEPEAFTQRQIELVQTFADQAVIAIQNVRLFEEVQARTRDLSESLQQQTATADVLKVISRSTFDLQTVLRTLVESAARLSDADKATIARQRGDVFYHSESYGFTDEFMRFVRTVSRRAGARIGAWAGFARRARGPHSRRHGRPRLHLQRSAATGRFPRHSRGSDAARGHADRRDRADPDRAKAVHRQANRTGDDLRRPGRDRDRKRAAVRQCGGAHPGTCESRWRICATAQDRLVQTEKLASLGQLTAGIAHEIKNPLNFVNNFSALSAELIEELKDVVLGHRDVDERQARGARRNPRLVEEQPRKGRTARQARQLHRQEHVAAFSPGFRRAPPGRYQCDRR